MRAEVAGLNPDSPDEILVGANIRNRKLMDVRRLNLKTGALTLDTENPGDVTDWGTDAKFQIRAAQVQTPDGGTEIRVRDDVKAPWKTLLKVGPDEILEFEDFSLDGKSAFLKSSIGSDTARLVSRDISTGAEKTLAVSPEVDAGDTVIQPKTHVVQAVSFAAGRATWTVLDPSVKADFEGIAKLTDGDFFLVSRTRADDAWLVAFTTDRGSGPSNLRTLVASIPPYWKPMRAMLDVRMGNVDDPKDADLIRNASPLFRADRITKPLLIGQGANDPRVNVKESEQIVDAIEKNKGNGAFSRQFVIGDAAVPTAPSCV